MKSVLIEIINRLKSESPKFFVVLRWIFGVLAVAAVTFKWVITKELWEPTNVKLVTAIQEVCEHIITIASTMWFSSLLPVKDTISEEGNSTSVITEKEIVPTTSSKVTSTTLTDSSETKN